MGDTKVSIVPLYIASISHFLFILLFPYPFFKLSHLKSRTLSTCVLGFRQLFRFPKQLDIWNKKQESIGFLFQMLIFCKISIKFNYTANLSGIESIKCPNNLSGLLSPQHWFTQSHSSSSVSPSIVPIQLTTPKVFNWIQVRTKSWPPNFF